MSINGIMAHYDNNMACISHYFTNDFKLHKKTNVCFQRKHREKVPRSACP